MKIECIIYAVLWFAITNPLDALRECNRNGDCGAVHYCLNSYCEPCIPCKDLFNRQQAQSLSGMAICAKHEDDCGSCLPGYQAGDLAQQRRTMHCFRLPEKEDALPVPVAFVSWTTTMLLALAIVVIFGIYIKRKFAGRIKNSSAVLGIRPIPLHETNRLIMDGLPTYDEAVKNLSHVSDSNMKEHVSVTDGQESDRELNAELDLLLESSVVEADISTSVISIDSVSNPPKETVLPINRIGDKSIIEISASSNEEQVNNAEVLQPHRSSSCTIIDKFIVDCQIASFSKESPLAPVIPQSPSTSFSLGPERIENKIEIAPSTTNSTLESYQHHHGSSEHIEKKIRKRREFSALSAAFDKFNRLPFKRIANWFRMIRDW